MLKNPPLVSIIIPSYNHEKFIEATIRSVISQTYENIELIILDDGSVDGSIGKIKNLLSLCEKRFDHFSFIKKANEGVAKTLNMGIRLAKGDYISIADSDDVLTPDKIKLLMDRFMLLGKEYGAVFANADFIDSQGKAIYFDFDENYRQTQDRTYRFNTFIEFYTRKRTDFNFEKEFGVYRTFLIGNYVPSMASIIRKDVLYEVGLYQSDNALEDLDMWFKISKEHRIMFINRVVVHYRWHDTNSVKVLKDRVTLDMTKLLLRERSYCYKNGLKKKWSYAFCRQITAMIKNKEFKILAKLMTIRVFIIYISAVIEKIKLIVEKK